MGTVRLATVAALLVLAAPGKAEPAANQIAMWRPIVIEASARFGVPSDWIERVIRAESAGFATIDGKPIRSRAGAIGLMQVMPATWTAMRARYGLGNDPDDPHDNIVAGTAYLRLMVDRFGYPGCFAAYNAGPDRYAAYLAGRSGLPAETIAYLAGITGARPSVAVTIATPPRELLFALRRDLGGPVQSAAGPSASGELFAIRKGLP